MTASFHVNVLRTLGLSAKKKWKNEIVTLLSRYCLSSAKIPIPTSFTIPPPSPHKFVWKLFVSFFRQKNTRFSEKWENEVREIFYSLSTPRWHCIWARLFER